MNPTPYNGPTLSRAFISGSKQWAEPTSEGMRTLLWSRESFFERTGFQLTLKARARASRHMRVGGLGHPGHCGALRRMGDRVNDHLEERIVEIVTWKCLDRLRHEVLRQIVESL